jgi:hypothetical protein
MGFKLGLTQALQKLGVLGSGAVKQIKHSSNFCGYSCKYCGFGLA